MTPLESNLSLFPESENREEWRIVKNYPNYAVSDFGRVKRLTTITNGKAGRILKTTLQIGYPRLVLCNENGNKSIFVHRLVADAFIVVVDGKPEVNHIDGDRSNPKLENLEWCSRQENTRHSYKSGFQNAAGENNGQSVLTWDKVAEIREICSDPNRPSFPKIGKLFGVTESAIRSVFYMKTWVPSGYPSRAKREKKTKNKPMSFFSIVIRNAKQRGAKGITSVSLLEQKMAYYEWKCRYCGASLDSNNRSLDHAIPIGRGGTN